MQEFVDQPPVVWLALIFGSSFFRRYLLNGVPTSSNRSRVLSAGYQVHVGKPVEPGELVAAVANLIKAKSAGRS
jgi:hypothetical protein